MSAQRRMHNADKISQCRSANDSKSRPGSCHRLARLITSAAVLTSMLRLPVYRYSMTATAWLPLHCATQSTLMSLMGDQSRLVLPAPRQGQHCLWTLSCCVYDTWKRVAVEAHLSSMEMDMYVPLLLQPEPSLWLALSKVQKRVLGRRDTEQTKYTCSGTGTRSYDSKKQRCPGSASYMLTCGLAAEQVPGRLFHAKLGLHQLKDTP